MSFPYIIQGNNVTVIIGSTPHTISNTHITYEKVLDAIKNQDWDAVKELIEPKQIVINFGQGNIEIRDNVFYWRDRELHNSLTTRIIQMIKDGFSVEPFINFMQNLMQNPSKRSVDELYTFLECNNLPITPDGCFLAYKKINTDYTDVHSSTVINKPAYLFDPEQVDELKTNACRCGSKNEVSVYINSCNETEVAMERNFVDDDKDRTCSNGLHFCSMEYLDHFYGDRIVIVKINPADVVSIPADYNNSKGRTCKYTVIGELGVDPDQAFTQSVQENANAAEQSATVEQQAFQFSEWPQPVNYF